MPEGPELRHARDKLRFLLSDPRVLEEGGESLGPALAIFYPFKQKHLLDGVDPKLCFDGRYANALPTGFAEFHRDVENAGGGFRILNVDVKGKFMWWELGFGYTHQPTWWMHCTYGMSGRWESHRVYHDSAIKHATANVRYERFAGSRGVDGTLIFTDPRHFGTLKFISNKELHDKKLLSLGPDMLGAPPTLEEFTEILKRKPKATLPEVLMNQGVISGVGNYIKAEALYRAKLSPHRLVSSLSDDDFTSLRQEIIAVMNEAYTAKGATIRTYATVDGNSGNAQFLFQCYGKKIDKLGNDVVKEETKDGRTTHWCPAIQI